MNIFKMFKSKPKEAKPREKVYCGRCRYIVKNHIFMKCGHPSNMHMKDTPIYQIPIYLKDIDELNKHNDCALYKERPLDPWSCTG